MWLRRYRRRQLSPINKRGGRADRHGPPLPRSCCNHGARRRPRNTAKSLSWGAIAGFSSFVSHAGGPPFQVAVMPLRLPPPVYAGTSVLFFASTNAVKLIPYFLLGQFSADNLATSAVLMPLAPVATLAGVWLVRRVPSEGFYKVIYGLLVLVGGKLMVDGARGLLA